MKKWILLSVVTLILSGSAIAQSVGDIERQTASCLDNLKATGDESAYLRCSAVVQDELDKMLAAEGIGNTSPKPVRAIKRPPSYKHPAGGSRPSSQGWMHPSDQAYQRAIDAGFGGHALSTNGPQHMDLQGVGLAMGGGVFQHIEIQPPLYCAFIAGRSARANLESEPSVKSVKLGCDGFLVVMVTHFSQSLGANWRCVLQAGGKIIKPLRKHLDTRPWVATYSTPWKSDEAGYGYLDTYGFTAPPASVPGATIVVANRLGKRYLFKIPTSLFEEDASWQ